MAAVAGTIAVFVVALGLGMPSMGVVIFGIVLLVLAVALGSVNVVRRGARAWVTGTAEVRSISPPPASAAVYGRARIMAVVVAPGLPTSEVEINESKVPVVKWPAPGDTLPITVDVDDMRRVRINWDDAVPGARGEDPPPPAMPDYDDYEAQADDDTGLLDDFEPPPWKTRDRQWGRGPDEPPPPPPPSASPPPPALDDTQVVVRDTPAGPVVEGEFVDHDDTPQTLPRRAQKAESDTPTVAATAGAAAAGAAAGAASTPGTRRPSPHPHRSSTATATADPETRTTTTPTQREPHPDDELPTDIPLDEPPAQPQRPEPVPTSAPATPSPVGSFPTAPPPSTPPPTAPSPSTPRPSVDDEIDLPLDANPEPAPETTPHAAAALQDDLIAPPAETIPNRPTTSATAEPATTGPATTGPDAAGPDAAGPDAAGPDAAGPDAAGAAAAGAATAGAATAGAATADRAAAYPVAAQSEAPAQAQPVSGETVPDPSAEPRTAPIHASTRFVSNAAHDASAPSPTEKPSPTSDTSAFSGPTASSGMTDEGVAAVPWEPEPGPERDPDQDPEPGSARIAAVPVADETGTAEARTPEAPPQPEPKHGLLATAVGAVAAAAVAAVKKAGKHDQDRDDQPTGDRPTDEPATAHSAADPTGEPATPHTAAGPTSEPATAHSAAGPAGEPATPHTAAGPAGERATSSTTAGAPAAATAAVGAATVPEPPGARPPAPAAAAAATIPDGPEDPADRPAAVPVSFGGASEQHGARTSVDVEETSAPRPHAPSPAAAALAEAAAAAAAAGGAGKSPWAGLGGTREPDESAADLITAYPSARPGPAGAIHGVGITVLVTDLGRSIGFYRDTLGFYEIDHGEGSAVLASGDTRLVLRTVHGLSAEAGRLIYLNLEVGDVEAVYEELRAKGVEFVHAPRPVNRGDRLELWSASFRDPDDHNIAITQWRAIH
ncbi:VOC family protein [Actinoplanes sp. NPDC000266]